MFAEAPASPDLRRVRARRRPYRDRRTAGLGGAQCLRGAQDSASRPPITRVFRNICRSAAPDGSPTWCAAGSTRCCAGSMRPRGAIMVATASIERELPSRGFQRLHRWSRGVDLSLFRPGAKDLAEFEDLPRPRLLYVGRLAVEKNLPAFLGLKTPGSKIVVGDGPDVRGAETGLSGRAFSRRPAGPRTGALLCGGGPVRLPVAGRHVRPRAAGSLRLRPCESPPLPAPGPLDIFGWDSDIAALDADLGRAVARALAWPTDPERPRAFAERFTWAACTDQFLEILRLSPTRATRQNIEVQVAPREAPRRLRRGAPL